MELSGQRHATAALPPPPYTMHSRMREPLWGIEPRFLVVRPVQSLYSLSYDGVIILFEHDDDKMMMMMMMIIVIIIIIIINPHT
jgi:hypothetical protein